MKRSEINEALLNAMTALGGNKISLPRFAHWKPGAWENLGPEYRSIMTNGLG